MRRTAYVLSFNEKLSERLYEWMNRGTNALIMFGFRENQSSETLRNLNSRGQQTLAFLLSLLTLQVNVVYLSHISFMWERERNNLKIKHLSSASIACIEQGAPPPFFPQSSFLKNLKTVHVELYISLASRWQHFSWVRNIEQFFGKKGYRGYENFILKIAKVKILARGLYLLCHKYLD